MKKTGYENYSIEALEELLKKNPTASEKKAINAELAKRDKKGIGLNKDCVKTLLGDVNRHS